MLQLRLGLGLFAFPKGDGGSTCGVSGAYIVCCVHDAHLKADVKHDIGLNAPRDAGVAPKSAKERTEIERLAHFLLYATLTFPPTM